MSSYFNYITNQNYGVGSFYKYYGSDGCIYQDEIYYLHTKISKVRHVLKLYKTIPEKINKIEWTGITDNYWQYLRSVDELVLNVKSLFCYYESSIVMFGMKNNIIPEDTVIDYKGKKYHEDNNVWSLLPQITTCFEKILTICIPDSFQRIALEKRGISFENIESLIHWYKFILEKKQEEMDKQESDFSLILEDLESGKNPLERYTELYPRELLM